MKIGPIALDAPFCQAGLAGYSDRAMRTVARRRGCPYALTEALLDVILLSGGLGLKKSIDIADDDHPVAGQVIGSEPDGMSGRRPDHGRPRVRRGRPELRLPGQEDQEQGPRRAHAARPATGDRHPAGDSGRGADRVPMTVSLRRGFDDTPRSVDRFYELVDAAWDAGYAAVRVHGRTVEQKYAGRASWPFLAEVKRRYPDRTILGSGRRLHRRRCGADADRDRRRHRLDRPRRDWQPVGLRPRSATAGRPPRPS